MADKNFDAGSEGLAAKPVSAPRESSLDDVGSGLDATRANAVKYYPIRTENNALVNELDPADRPAAIAELMKLDLKFQDAVSQLAVLTRKYEQMTQAA